VTTPLYEQDYAVAAGHTSALSFIAGTPAALQPDGLAVVHGMVLMVDATGAVVPAAAVGAAYVGVAGNDAYVGGPVTVLVGSGVIHETAVSAAVAAGAFVAASPAANAGAVVGAALAAGTNTLGVCVRAGALADNAATPPTPAVPCRWLAYK
jgi:hypothetical protein